MNSTYKQKSGANSGIIIEWAPFELLEGTEETLLLAASAVLQSDFLDKQEGFIKRELLKGNGNHWVDMVYWQNRESAERAMENVASSPACLAYFKLMAETDHNDLHADVSHFISKCVYGTS
ncbi:antibiotic biosynthesis monooxygenase [Leptospira sp. WS92.C1]